MAEKHGRIVAIDEYFTAEHMKPIPAVNLYPASSISLRIFSAVRAELAPFKQRDVADVLGITESRVSQLLAGGQNWTLDTVTRLLMAAEKLNKRVKL